MSLPGKRITQSTFDDVVRENIEDLELEPADAICDAREQFVAQVRRVLLVEPNSLRVLLLGKPFSATAGSKNTSSRLSLFATVKYIASIYLKQI